MVAVDISSLDSNLKDEVQSFMESKLAVKVEREGDTLTFEDKDQRTHVSNPEIRTYLKRFLHKNELRKDYRLLSDEGTLSFVKQKKEKESEEEKEEKKK